MSIARFPAASISPESRRFRPPTAVLSPRLAPSRSQHGGLAWSLPSRGGALRQPQDGAATHPPVVAQMPTYAGGGLIQGRLPFEPEDARLTGLTRSLNRRLLGLNVGVAAAEASGTSNLESNRRPAAALALLHPRTQVA